jgi:glycosyltransferase involved in cell wall biosynthesis
MMQREVNQDNKPLVTIGIPSYNYGHYILETLESIARQDYKNMEIIVVDDCSTDDSLPIIKNWIKKYEGSKTFLLKENKQNLGLTKVCNLLLNNARGKYFQPLDADDVLMPGKISRQVQLLEENDQAAIVYSNAYVINEKGIVTEDSYLGRIHYEKDKMPSGFILDRLLEFNFVCLPTVLIDTDRAREMGGFNEDLQVQDYYMWLKLAERYEILYMNEITAKYRVHAASMGTSSITNTKSEDSVLNIKYPYYAQSNPVIKKIIKRNIQNSSVYLFEQGYPTAKKWTAIAFRLKPGPKTFFYFMISRLGIPYALIRKLKTVLGAN